MPRAIDLFLDTDQPLDRLADQLSHLTGLAFLPAPDRRRFVMHDGDVIAHLSDHDFVDDDGLSLSEFRYVLSTSLPYGADLETSPEVASLRRFSALLREQGALPSLLVIDLERPDVERPDVERPDVERPDVEHADLEHPGDCTDEVVDGGE